MNLQTRLKFAEDDEDVNWNRGLFRLWLVLSLIWIFGAAWILDPVRSVRAALGPIEFQVDDSFIKFPVGTDAATVGKRLREFYRSQNERRCAAGDDFCGSSPLDDAQLEAKIREYQPADLVALRWGIARAIGIMFLPPIGMMLIALSIAWIGSGFREPPSKRLGHSGRDLE